MFEVATNKIYQFSRTNIKTRISEIDFLRGVCIILMIVDHFFLIFGTINERLFGAISATSPIYLLTNFSLWWWYWNVRLNVRIAIICLFFFVSGVSSYFSRNNIRRGLLIFIVSLIINVVMFGAEVYLGIEGMVTYFGAINAFGVTILIYALYELLMNKLKVKEPYRMRITLVIGLIFALIGFTATLLFDLNTSIGREDLTLKLFFEHALGFVRVRSVGDYIPLLPYFGFFFIGAGLSSLLYKTRQSIFTPLYKYIPECPKQSNYSNVYTYCLALGGFSIYQVFNSIVYLIKKCGRYSLIIYLVHQFILLLLLIIIMYSLGYSIQL